MPPWRNEDALALGANFVRSAGSSPAGGTKWSVRLRVRTLGFHPRNRGSNPLPTTIYALVDKWFKSSLSQSEVTDSNSVESTIYFLRKVNIFE